jgi:predicted DCC family thiol-disulfide oxidoreductase YuxK
LIAQMKADSSRAIAVAMTFGRLPFRLQKSGAVIAVLQVVGGGWKAAAPPLRLLPRAALGRIYGFVAANRHKWFGRGTACFIPRP